MRKTYRENFSFHFHLLFSYFACSDGLVFSPSLKVPRKRAGGSLKNARKKHVLRTHRTGAAEHGLVLFQKGLGRSQEQNQKPRVRSRCSGCAGAPCSLPPPTALSTRTRRPALPLVWPSSLSPPRHFLVLLHSFCLVMYSSCFQVTHDPVARTFRPSLTPRSRAANNPRPHCLPHGCH